MLAAVSCYLQPRMCLTSCLIYFQSFNYWWSKTKFPPRLSWNMFRRAKQLAALWNMHTSERTAHGGSRQRESHTRRERWGSSCVINYIKVNRWSSLVLRWRPCARNCWSRCVTSWGWRTVTCLDSVLFRVSVSSLCLALAGQTAFLFCDCSSHFHTSGGWVFSCVDKASF